jgi:hypothetical protein
MNSPTAIVWNQSKNFNSLFKTIAADLYHMPLMANYVCINKKEQGTF